MPTDTQRPPLQAPASWPRWAARGSLLAAFVCFAMNCTFMQLTSKQPPEETQLANQLVGWSSLAVVVGGIIAGAAAVLGSWRERPRDTLAIAALGLVINVGIVLVTLWLLYQISLARDPSG